MCNPDCILNRPFNDDLIAEVDELTDTPEFQADIEDGWDFCAALARAQRRPMDGDAA